ALYGPLHGGANEAVLRMIEEIGTVKNVPAFISEVKSGKGGRLMGFGHRVYKSYDPRAKIVKQLANEVFNAVGMDRDLEIALKLERIALSDDYFVSRKLYPNVDFYTGLIYRAMKFPTDFFTVLFAVARTSGWLAQWEEMLLDKEQKIARPRQIYTGYGERPYAHMLDRNKKVTQKKRQNERPGANGERRTENTRFAVLRSRLAFLVSLFSSPGPRPVPVVYRPAPRLK